MPEQQNMNVVRSVDFYNFAFEAFFDSYMRGYQRSFDSCAEEAAIRLVRHHQEATGRARTLIVDSIKERLSLRERRERLRLTQAQLAVQAGISRTHVSALENGTRKAGSLALLSAARLCQVLGMTMEDLLVGDENGQK